MKQKISIILPVFNGETYLSKSIDSIIKQTFKDFEFLIIDDGSTDKTPQIIREKKQIDCRIKYIRTKNNGIVDALNLGLANAQGEYIARMDADDVALTTRLEKQVEYLDQNPDCVIVSNSIGVIDNKERLLAYFSESNRGPFSPGNDEVSKAIDVGTFLMHPTVMYRKYTAIQIGGYRKDFEWIEDADFYNRIIKEGKAYCLPEVLLHYRVHLDSVTRTKSNIQQILKAKLASELQNSYFPVPIEIPLHNSRHEFKNTKAAFLRKWSYLSYHNGGAKLVSYSLAINALMINPWNKQSWINLLLIILGDEFVANIVQTKIRINCYLSNLNNYYN